jgi:hypothetical protein
MRVNAGGAVVPSSRSPDAGRIAAPVGSSSSWFFGANASSEGVMIATRAGSSPFQTNAVRENTVASAAAT